MFYPNTMMEALGLAKLVEDKIRAQQRSKSTFVPVPFRNMVPQRPQILPAPITTPIEHSSEVDMWERREKGLDYNCDEKLTRGHRCVEKKLHFLDVDSSSAHIFFYDTQHPVGDEDDIQQLFVDPLSQDDHP